MITMITEDLTADAKAEDDPPFSSWKNIALATEELMSASLTSLEKYFACDRSLQESGASPISAPQRLHER